MVVGEMVVWVMVDEYGVVGMAVYGVRGMGVVGVVVVVVGVVVMRWEG